jgi:sodium-dependent dicarboxylate transporter 2/3/5
MLRGKMGSSVPSEDSPLVPAKEGGEDDQNQRVQQKSSSDLLVKIAIFTILSAVLIGISTTFELSHKHPKATEALAVMIVTVVWFMAEIIPISIVSLMPLPLYALLDISSAAELTGVFFSSSSVILIVGQFLSLAVVRWGLHQRLCIMVAAGMGQRIETLVLGFMISAWFLSFWISNTATTLSLLPAAQAFLETVPREGHGNFHAAFLLAIAFSATAGGIATPVGTPPNAIFMQQMRDFWPEEEGVSFLMFMAAAFPLSLLLLGLIWLGFCVGFVWWKDTPRVEVDRQLFIKRRASLPKFSYEEQVVLLVALVLITLWFTASPINSFPGWTAHTAPRMDIGSIGIMCTLPLFIIPCGCALPQALQRVLGTSRCTSSTASEREAELPRFVLDWGAVRQKFNFDLLLCLGGANMIGQGTIESGLASVIAEQLARIQGPYLGYVAVILFVTSLTTEFVSNAATMGILGPVVAASASNSGRNAVNALLGSTFACSFSFALPTASGPNIVVYGTGQVKLLFLMRIGLAVELGALMIGTLWVSFAVPIILGPTTDGYGPPSIEGIGGYWRALVG